MPRALPPQDDQDLVAPTHLPKVPVEPLSAEHEKNPDLASYPVNTTAFKSDPFFHDHKSVPDDATIPIRVKISTAWNNLPSREKLQSKGHVVRVKKNGTTTIGTLKEQLAQLDGFPDAKNMQLLWFAKVLGRKYDYDDLPRGTPTDHLNEYVPDEHALTLNDYNVIPWLLKFPHWEIVATVLDRAPPDRYEAIHRAVAENKGVEDVDKHIRKLKKSDKWTTFLETDVEQTAKNRAKRLGPFAGA